jgi:natural product precursor
MKIDLHGAQINYNWPNIIGESQRLKGGSFLTIKFQKMKKLKLPKFELEHLSVEDMDAIKAGSGGTNSDGTTVCTGSDHDSKEPDTD